MTCEEGHVNSPSNGGWSCTICNKPLHLVDRTYQAYCALQSAKATFEALEAQLLEQVRPEYREAAMEGDFSKTLNVAGQETSGVQFSFKDAFTTIPAEKEDVLREKVGEKYDNYFYQKRDISVADTSDEVVSLLLDKLGADDFTRLFKIQTSVGTKPDLDRKQFSLPQSAQLIIQQYKPSMKLRKDD